MGGRRIARPVRRRVILAVLAVAVPLVLTGCLSEQIISLESGPHALAVGDFNKDGLLEFFVTNTSTDTVSVYAQDARRVPHLTGKLILPPRSAPADVAVGSFDGGKRRTVVVADRGTDRFSLFTSIANGAKPAREVSMGPDAQPAAVAIADVNGDGYDDLIVATTKPTLSLGGSYCNVRGCVVVFWGSKSGLRLGLDAKTLVLPLGVDDMEYLPEAIAAGDIAGNGELDIAVGLVGTNEVVLIPGAGRGKFAPPSEYKRVAVPRPVALLVARSGGKPVVLAKEEGSVYAVVSLVGAGSVIKTTGSLSDIVSLANSAPLKVVDTSKQVAVGSFDGDKETTLDAAFLSKAFVGASGAHHPPLLQVLTTAALFDGPTSMDFGSVAVGKSGMKQVKGSLIVAQDNNEPLDASAQITGPDASSFALPKGACDGMQSNSDCATTVTFAPTSPGPKSATLSLGLSAGLQRFAGLPIKVTLTGTGTGTGTGAAPSGAQSSNTPKSWGVAEDASKYADDGGQKVYSDLSALGMSLNRWTLVWDGHNSDGSTESAFLARALAAKPAGVQVILSLYPDPGAFTKLPDGTRAAPDSSFITGFCAWAHNVAQRYRGKIDRFIVLNEPNLATFWPVANRAQTVEQTLASCYDAIKSANPDAVVAGLGLSARAPSSASTAPVDLINQIGAAYKASGRSAPLFDQLAVHPYPPQDKSINPTPPPADKAAGYAGTPSFYGINTLKRVKDAVNSAFAGSGQKTVAQGLKLVVDEYGYQVNMQGDSRYTGTESSSTVPDQATQADDYTAAVTRYFACDPDISDVLFFHLLDEKALGSGDGGGGWQSGMEEVDGTHRQSFQALHDAIAQGCVSPGPTYAG